jgi:hypothetical protein
MMQGSDPMRNVDVVRDQYPNSHVIVTFESSSAPKSCLRRLRLIRSLEGIWRWWVHSQWEPAAQWYNLTYCATENQSAKLTEPQRKGTKCMLWCVIRLGFVQASVIVTNTWVQCRIVVSSSMWYIVHSGKPNMVTWGWITLGASAQDWDKDKYGDWAFNMLFSVSYISQNTKGVNIFYRKHMVKGQCRSQGKFRIQTHRTWSVLGSPSPI